MPALKYAASGRWCPIFLHTHPGGRPEPSARDDLVDEAMRPVFQTRAGSSRYVSLVLGVVDGKPRMSGRVYELDQAPDRVSRVRVAGRQLRVHRTFGPGEDDLTDLDLDPYDRQILAFGEAGQRVLHDLRVGVVGAGGTGSSVAEQIIRLGVGTVALIDGDIVTSTNVTRIYGSTLADIDRPKVEVLHDHLTSIGLG